MTHNTLYERLVDEDENTVLGYVAYGLYKSAKREWLIDFKATNRRDPTAEEVAAYVSAYTDQTLSAFRNQAAGVLAAFAEEAVEDARQGIVEDALRGSFWGSVWQSIVANVAYTAILLALVIVLAFAGVDVLGIYEKVRGN